MTWLDTCNRQHLGPCRLCMHHNGPYAALESCSRLLMIDLEPYLPHHRVGKV